MINVVIFSKDRPCQLDALLRSMQDNMMVLCTKKVLYSCSSKDYESGYDILKNIHKDVLFVEEADFYMNTVELSIDLSEDFLLWMVDDCIMKNKLEYDSTLKRFEEDQNVGIYNLRLTPSTKRMTDWPEDKERPLPTFLSDNTWEWRRAIDEDWGYPMTMDGHMYKTKDMQKYLPQISFGPPPSFDCTMWQKPLNTKLMICNNQQKILGFVPNRVQTGWPNRFGNISIEQMNSMWLSGKQINLDSLYKLDESCGKYFYIDIDFEDRHA